jgi:hypothetical protein
MTALSCPAPRLARRAGRVCHAVERARVCLTRWHAAGKGIGYESQDGQL